MNRNRWILTLILSAGIFWTPGFVAAQSVKSNDAEIATQLSQDITPVPAGKGALFFPRLSASGSESPVVVEYDGRRVATAQTGKRIVLPPGEYTAFVGSGPQEIRARKDMRVVDGVTTPVSPFYGALSLKAVDREGNPIGVRYNLKQLGSTVAEVTTTIDEPGTVSLLRPQTALLKFEDDTEIAIEIPSGKHLELLVVFDGPSFAKLLPIDAEFSPEEKWWRARSTVGATFSFSDASDQAANFNGTFLQVGVFSKSEVGVDLRNHLALLSLDIEQSWIGLSTDEGRDLPTRKLLDEVDAELLYTYRLARIIGPYVRAKLNTSLFETNYYSDEDVTINVVGEADGALAADSERRLMDPFSPLYLEETAGLSLTPIDNDVVNFGLRAGAGFRQHYFRDGLFVRGEADQTLTLRRLQNEDFWGVSAGASTGLRLSQAFRLRVDADLFIPDDQLTDDEDLDILFEIDGLAEVAISSFASVVYRVRVSSRTTQTPTAIYHGLSLQLQHSLF